MYGEIFLYVDETIKYSKDINPTQIYKLNKTVVLNMIANSMTLLFTLKPEA